MTDCEYSRKSEPPKYKILWPAVMQLLTAALVLETFPGNVVAKKYRAVPLICPDITKDPGRVNARLPPLLSLQDWKCHVFSDVVPVCSIAQS